MRRLLSVAVVGSLLACGIAGAAEEIDANQLLASPDRYAGRNVTIAVRFGRIISSFRGWEEQASLKSSRYIKFSAKPLREINCYATRSRKDEEIISSLNPGQEITISGHLKKCKMEHKVKVKGDRPRHDGTVKREVKGAGTYVFIVNSIDNVGEAQPMRMRGGGRRRGRRRGF